MINEIAQIPISVSELNEYARRLLASDPLLRDVCVSGEISGYKHHYSGHRYFVLKDANARVQCVMFRQNAMGLDFQPADGMKITLWASASIFARDGSYQLYVTRMQRSGLGELYARFEALKAKLSAEGLFDPARKREIPMLPKKIGIVTSETGAAIRDIIRIARRRNPKIGILVAPCSVQGAMAAPEIICAIERLNQNAECDVLLVGRGGGSIEDLWAFNEEPVARAIAASRIPVISCVGHEIDFTIADFVADLRAATPSAAAELAVPVLDELRDSLDRTRQRLARALVASQRLRRSELDRWARASVFTMPRRVLLERQGVALSAAQAQLNAAMQARLEQSRRKLSNLENMLRALNPDSVLDRGYALIRQNGRIMERISGIQAGAFTVRMSDGEIDALTTEIRQREE